MIGFDFKFKSPLNYTTSFLSDNDDDKNFDHKKQKWNLMNKERFLKGLRYLKIVL